MTANSTLIRVSKISKIYKLYDNPIDRLKESLSFFNTKYHKEFPALNNISFELSKGESLGIIGKNGHGKSTLLKIIGGILSPSSGKISSFGRISAIFELTSNLKPELTGLENIKLNLKISGFEDYEIEVKSREIVDFAELGDFVQRPVKIYSSGMKARLGFGIAISSEPDILILDEVLAVGDFDFQQKCLGKINEIRKKISIIFVSHSMNSVRNFCDRAIVLENGKLAFDGKPNDAVNYYLEKEEKRKKLLEKNSKMKAPIKDFYGNLFHNKKKIYEIKFSWNKKEYKKNEEMILFFSFKLSYKPVNLIIGVPIWSENGDIVTGVSSKMNDINIKPSSDGIYQGKVVLKNIFYPGKYINVLSIYDGQEALFREIDKFESIYNKNQFFAHIIPEHTWDIK